MRRPFAALIVLATLAALPSTARADEPGRFYLGLNAGVVAYSYTASTATAPATNFTTADRGVVLDQLAVGWWARPQLRLQLIAQFTETAWGLPSGASPLTLWGFIPCVVWTPGGGFFVGAGAILALRSGGKDQFDTGIFDVVGYGWRLGGGWVLAAAVQVPVMLAVRPQVAIAPAINLGYRF